MRLAAVLLSLLASLTLPRTAAAQGEDAVPLRPGMVRLGIAPDWARWNRRFGSGTPGYADGSLEPFGVDFTAESLGVQRLPFLVPSQSTLRSVTGLSAFLVNLGRAEITMNASVRVIPLTLELGLTRRVGLSVMLPLVRARTEVFVLGPSEDTSVAGRAAAQATRGNVGLNPRFAQPAALQSFMTQVDSALVALQRRAANPADPLRAQAQATLSSLQPLLCGLYTLGGGSAASAGSLCYSATPVAFSPVLPVDTSAAGDSITLRLQRAEASYQQLQAQYAAMGVSLPPLTAGYTLPKAPLDSLGLRQLFIDPNFPLASDSLTTIVRTRLGDMEVAASFQLADQPRLRSQLVLLARLPTGHVNSKDSFVELPTGDHQLDLEVGLRNDVIVGSDFWVHVGGRFGTQSSDQLERRVAPADFPFAPLLSTALVRRQLGSYYALDVVPNWRLDDAFSLGLGYHYFHRNRTGFSYVNPGDELLIGLPASVLDQETEISQMRIGAGLTFSTIARYAARQANLPYTVTASYQNTLWGRGGAVPQASVFHLTIRGYFGVKRIAGQP